MSKVAEYYQVEHKTLININGTMDKCILYTLVLNS